MRRPESEVAPVRAEARRLRLEGGLTNAEIVECLGAAKSSVYAWLLDIPLTEGAREARAKPRRDASIKRRQRSDTGLRRTERGLPSKWWPTIEDRNPGNADRGRIGEAAVLFRLAVLGFEVFGSPFDGARCDFVVCSNEVSKPLKIQVKVIRAGKWGMPTLPVRRSYGAAKTKRRYLDGEADFIVGYDLMTDTAYVYSFGETRHLSTSVSVTQDAAEAWWKLTGSKAATASG
jgi:hypothetical protein